ncbi:MAG: hypothetical protein LR011_00860 [Verrucomicrobia bacterium]|nr:hypothetical protein [Verrucomicrobiota bacterium]
MNCHFKPYTRILFNSGMCNGPIPVMVRNQSGAEILTALMAYAHFPSFPIHQPFLQGTTASSIHGTRLGFGEFG